MLFFEILFLFNTIRLILLSYQSGSVSHIPLLHHLININFLILHNFLKPSMDNSNIIVIASIVTAKATRWLVYIIE